MSQEGEYKQILDSIVKINYKIIFLSILSERLMCVHEIIKEIFPRCDIFLSQGSGYPHFLGGRGNFVLNPVMGI